MTHHDVQTYDDDGQPVSTCEPVYPDDEPSPPEDNRAAEALGILRAGLLLVIASDSPRTRAAALGFLSDLFESPAQAARAIHVHRSTMLRSIRRLKKELRLQQAK